MATDPRPADEAIQFNWTRYEGGYEWQKAADAEATVSQPFAPRVPAPEADWVLTNDRPIGSYEDVPYSPPADLFLKFVKTERTREGIKEFADRYGLLGLKEGRGRVFITIPADRADRGAIQLIHGKTVTGFAGSGELLSAWRNSIRDMDIAVEIWNMLRDAEEGSDQALRRFIIWRGPDRVFYETPAESRKGYERLAVIASPKIRPEILKRFQPESVIGPAFYFLQSLINDALEGLASPKLLWSRPRRGRPKVHTGHQTLGLFFVPRSLLGYLWLQLAEAVAGQKTFRRCKSCATWILVAPGAEGSRTSRLTCSNTCRVRLYQNRIKDAARLFAKGKSVEQIARQLGAETSRVRRWVRAKPRTQGSRHSGAR
jgi:hypothetical protein